MVWKCKSERIQGIHKLQTTIDKTNNIKIKHKTADS